MPVLLFHLSGVPEDEADDVRELLSTHHIDFYETQAGFWGTGVSALWLREEQQLAAAQELLHDYQQARSERMRNAYDALRAAGEHERLIDRFRRHPIRVLIFLALIAAVLYLSFLPVMGLGWGGE